MSQQDKHLEIERRWLLSGLPKLDISTAIIFKRFRFVTLYIVNDPKLEVRIRERYGNGEITYSVVTKIGSGLTRQESPKLSASTDLFNYYVTLGKPHIAKNHFEIILPSGQKWEVNHFYQPTSVHGLILAEMEFDSEKAAKKFGEQDFPDWLKPLIVKEVTDDPRYNGKNLAVHGKPNPE